MPKEKPFFALFAWIDADMTVFRHLSQGRICRIAEKAVPLQTRRNENGLYPQPQKETMTKKKNGMPFEVYPTPGKGKDGKNILYARPVGGRRMRITLDQIDDYCAKNSLLNCGQLKLVMTAFKQWASEMMAEGYRIDTPIGSFAPKLRMKGEFTDPDEVGHDDVELDGVDYDPGKIWTEAIGHWMHDGFRKVERTEASGLLADKEYLEEALAESLKDGYTTARRFAYQAKLTLYSARKQLNEWTEGECPKLMKSRMGQQDIYTET